MTQMMSSIMNMEKMLYSGQVPVRERLTLPMKDEDIKINNRYSNYNNRHSNYNNNAPAHKRFKASHGQFEYGMSLPDDLVLTEITEDGPKAARKKISFSSD